MLTAAALVLLLLVAACANLGTLVLARGVTREREIRVRMALGAGRLRVVRQLFTESLLLAVLSGLCALLLSTVVLKVIQLQHNSNREHASRTGACSPPRSAPRCWRRWSSGCRRPFGSPAWCRRAGRARTIFLARYRWR